jgi:hypothetical protein
MLPFGLPSQYPPVVDDDRFYPGLPSHIGPYPTSATTVPFSDVFDYIVQPWSPNPDEALYWKFVPTRTGLIRLDVSESVITDGGYLSLETWNDYGRYDWNDPSRDFSIGVFEGQPVWIALSTNSTSLVRVILRISDYAPETVVSPAGRHTMSFCGSNHMLSTDVTLTFSGQQIRAGTRKSVFVNSYTNEPDSAEISLEKEMLWRSDGARQIDPSNPYYGVADGNLLGWHGYTGLWLFNFPWFTSPASASSSDYTLPYSSETTTGPSGPGGVVAPVGPVSDSSIPDTFAFSYGSGGSDFTYAGTFHTPAFSAVSIFPSVDMGFSDDGTPSEEVWSSPGWTGRNTGGSGSFTGWSLNNKIFAWNVVAEMRAPYAAVAAYNTLFVVEQYYADFAWDIVKSDLGARGASDYGMVSFEYSFDHITPDSMPTKWSNLLAPSRWPVDVTMPSGEIEVAARIRDTSSIVDVDGSGLTNIDQLMAGTPMPNIDSAAPAWHAVPSGFIDTLSDPALNFENPKYLTIQTKPVNMEAWAGGLDWQMAYRVTFDAPEYVTFNTYLPPLPDVSSDIDGAFKLSRARFTRS